MNKIKYLIMPAIIALTGCQVVVEKEIVYLSPEEVIMNANTFLNEQERNKSVEGLNNVHIVTCDRHEKFSCDYTVSEVVDNNVSTVSVSASQSYIKEMTNKKIENSEHIMDAYTIGTSMSFIVGKVTSEFDFKSEMQNTAFQGSSEGLTVFVDRAEFLGMSSLEQNGNIYYQPKMHNSTSTLFLSKKEESSFSVDKDFVTLVYWN